MDFQGFDFETAQEFFHKVMRTYLGTDDEGWIQSVIDKARVIGYTRLMRREIRRNGLDTEKGREKIAFWQKELGELLEKTDTLLFDRSELDIEADISNLQAVLDFVEKHLSAANCPVKAGMQITVAVEEIFVNIANYAYAPQKGRARVRVEISEEPIEVTITFIDKGVPYDPLKRQDPDVTLPAVDREIGGLGIFLVKKTMDDVTYEYKDGQNILKLKKNLK
jgi:anti-sigma regulatory factor (Ser/Thr protein kinase)